MTEAKTFGMYARNLRQAAELGLRQAAHKLGVASSFLSRVENNIDKPSGRLLAAMATLYGVSLDELSRRAKNSTTTATAHGHVLKANDDLRALYRMGAVFAPQEVKDMVEFALRKRNPEITDEEIAAFWLQLRQELPRLRSDKSDGI